MGRPEIKSSINHHVEKDSSFTLVCEQTDVIDASYHMEWITPIKDMVGDRNMPFKDI